MSKTRLGARVRAGSRKETLRRQAALARAAAMVDELLRGSRGYVSAGTGLVSVVVYVEKRSHLANVRNAVESGLVLDVAVEYVVSGPILPASGGKA